MCAWEILYDKEEEVKYDTVGTDITTLGRKLTLAFSFTRCEEAESPQPQSRHGFVPAPCEPAGREASAGSGDVAAPDRLSFPTSFMQPFPCQPGAGEACSPSAK